MNEYRENPVCNCPCISAPIQYTSMLRTEMVTQNYHTNKKHETKANNNLGRITLS